MEVISSDPLKMNTFSQEVEKEWKWKNEYFKNSKILPKSRA
jgi:hypothetical protein